MLRAVSGGGSSTPGSQTRFVSGVPSDATGVDGDAAFSDNGYAYQRTGGTYVVQGQWIGSPGQPGTNGSGFIISNGAPSNAVGNAGDTCFDVTNKLVYTPKGQPSQTPQGFFGVNVHIGYTSSYWPNMTGASYVSLFQQMGIQTCRTNIASAAKATNVLADIKTITAAGGDVLVVIDQAPNYTTDFTTNQTAGNTLGAAIANVLKGSGVVNIECTNECDGPYPAGPGTKITGNNPRGFVADGGSYDDFNPARFECWRGFLSGLMAGIRSVTSEFKLGYASGNAFPQTAFKMMLFGLDTTGAATKTPLVFGMFGGHFYDTESSNPLQYTCRSRTGSPVFVNSLAELRGLTGNATYDIPSSTVFDLYITEWGSRAADANQASFIGGAAAVYFNNRATYGIKGIYVYALFADSNDAGTGPIFGVNALNFGIIQADGTTKKASYTNYTNFCKGNTVVAPGGWPTIPRALPLPVYGSGAQVLAPLNTTDNALRSFTIPGGSMGPNTSLRITALFTCPTNANTKTFRVKWGGNIIYAASFTTTTITVNIEVILQNRGVLNAQVGQPVALLGPTFTAGPIQTWAIDTTVDQVVAFTAQAGVGTDQLTLERCSIELIG